MCSIGEDDFGDEGGVHAMIPDVKSIDEAAASDEVLCNKCKSPGGVYKLPFREAECKECFLYYARHKFRAALGSSKILPKDAKVILVFDGSSQSVVLLDMLHHAQTQNTFKRLHCDATVIYIDDYPLINEKDKSHEGHYQHLKRIEDILAKYDRFESFVVPLVHQDDVESSICKLSTLPAEYFTEKCERETFIGAIKSIKSLTSRQDFIKHHRSKLIAATAKHFGYQFAFTSDICSELATDLLAAVALGRGRSAALDVALVDDRLGGGIQLVRPLKDLGTSEIQLYMKAQGLYALQYLKYGEDRGSSASLQNLTKCFIDNLQQNFSSTVSTVFRTGSKIAANREMPARFKALTVNNCSGDEGSAQLFCSLCNSLLDYRESTTLLAVEFSRVVSENGSGINNDVDLDEKALNNLYGPKGRPYLNKLCHACRNICADDCDEKFYRKFCV